MTSYGAGGRPILWRIKPRALTASTCARQLSGTAPPSAEDDNLRPVDVDHLSNAPPPNPRLRIPGSRLRREAVRRSQGLPFEDLPFQAFQEALKVLRQDRAEKIGRILEARQRITALEAVDTGGRPEGEAKKQKRLKSLRDHVAELEVLADINDPEVKRKFENGMGDLRKPIYRLLAKRRWEAMDRKIIEQRITQFHIVPDFLPKFAPTMDVKLVYGRGLAATKYPPGAILPSTLTQKPPSLRLQVFDDHPRLLTVVVIDGDVPLPEYDRFGRRCHYLAANIPWSGAAHRPSTLDLERLDGAPVKAPVAPEALDSPNGIDAEATQEAVVAEVATHTTKAIEAVEAVTPATAPVTAHPDAARIAVPWLPPFSQKGSPYHRLAVFVLEQADSQQPLDVAALRALYGGREGFFDLRSLRDKFGLAPVGFTLFRAVWDADTDAVMARHGIAGVDVEFKPRRWRSLKTPRKARGWEAKRQGPKFRHLWKYTKRIA